MENITLDTHTPVTLMQLIIEAFRLPPASGGLRLQGIYQDRNKRCYQGYYYDRLQDVQTSQLVTLRVPERIKQTLVSGQQYVFKGTLQTSFRPDGVVEPVFLIHELVASVALPSESFDVDRLFARKLEFPAKDVDELLLNKLCQKQPPHLAIIYGVTSIVSQDVLTALGEAYTRYSFTEKRINTLSEEEIRATLHALDAEGYDAIALVRGGGPGQEVFDHPRVAEVALELRTPLITAIGHAEEITLTERLADKYLTTPTAFGTYLAQLVEEADSLAPAPVIAAIRPADEQQLIVMRVLLVIMVVLIFILLLTR